MIEKQFIKEHIQEFIEFRDKNYYRLDNGKYVKNYGGKTHIFTESELIDKYLKTIQ